MLKLSPGMVRTTLPLLFQLLRRSPHLYLNALLAPCPLDYGESHYIGPIKGAQPNSEAWVDGFPHDAWLDLHQYFVRAFKEGAYPAIKKDRIFMWSRPHMKSAEALHDVVPRPERWQLVSLFESSSTHD